MGEPDFRAQMEHRPLFRPTSAAEALNALEAMVRLQAYGEGQVRGFEEGAKAAGDAHREAYNTFVPGVFVLACGLIGLLVELARPGVVAHVTTIAIGAAWLSVSCIRLRRRHRKGE